MGESRKNAHIDEVERVSSGAQSLRDAIVMESWRRCVDIHGLDPARMREAYIVPEAQLRQHQERMESLIRTARFGLETLYRQVANLGYVLLLSDAEGITVDFIGDPTFNNHLRKAGLYLGANWKEQFAGTCAVGSCLATQEALIVHQTDHFDLTHTQLTCTAAPIHDVDGRLAAVLDISALRSPEAKESQFLALQIVKLYTRRIELANLMGSFRSEWVVRLSRSHEFLDVEPDCALALDAAGRIAGFTHDAQRLLAHETGADWHRPEMLIGQPFESFFDFDPNNLAELTRGTPAEERSIGVRSGSMLFAHAIAPQNRLPKRVRRRPIPQPFRQLSGSDSSMKAMLEKAARLIDSSISILIVGETGTGKEYLARALHQARRVPGKFVAINCAALPESLIESELFGYMPGAFTGALAKGRKGLIQQAQGGTLFLDEIGDMPLALQARLLRVLSEREVQPVGAGKPIPIDIRVIAATHQDLISLVKTGQFRDDLYYRLNGAVLPLPALRERQDLAWMIEHLIALNPHRDGRRVRLTGDAVARLHAYHWPGNIRELANALDFAVAICRSESIGVDDLPDFLRSPTSPSLSDSGDNHKAGQQNGAARLTAALAAHGWNVSATARSLGVDRTTVHRKMRRLGILPPNRRGA